VGWFRIAKRFRVESGHRLSKHPELCRFPHGHTRTVEVVLGAGELDDNDMVCDYKALKLIVEREVERFDHAMVLAADDPLRDQFAPFADRVVLLDDGDPTTENMARYLYRRIREAFAPGATVASGTGVGYTIPGGVRVESVRVWETPSTWAEYGEKEP